MADTQMKWCPKCETEKPVSEFFKNRARRDGLSGYCKTCNTATVKAAPSGAPEVVARYQATYYELHRDEKLAVSAAWREKLRQQALVAYGRACSCCGETEEMFLTLDHVDGRDEEHKGLGTYAVLRRARDEGFPDTYRLLCWNCNCGRQRNGGVCPHEMRRLEVVNG